MFKFIVVILIVILPLVSKGQDTLNSALVESKSYELFLKKDWRVLIKYVREANNKGYNYYYLNLRLAIAHFELGNYGKAASEFKKVLAFDSSDQLALEYLYYCNLYNGNRTGARLISAKFNPELKSKINEPVVSLLNDLRLEGGLKLSSLSEKGLGNISLFEIGSGQYLGKRISITESYSKLTQTKYSNVLYQTQFYAAVNFQLAPKFSVTPTVHLINVDYLNSVYKEYAFGLILNKRTSYFNFSPFLSHGVYSQFTQSQKGFSVAYYPFGNNKLFTTSTLNMHRTVGYPGYLVFRQSLSVGNSKVFLTLDYCKGDEVINFTNTNSYVVNNVMDVSNYKISANINFQIGSRLNWFVFAQYDDRATYRTNTNYQFNTLTTGLKFKL